MKASELKELKQQGSGTLRPHYRGTWIFREMNPTTTVGLSVVRDPEGGKD